MGPHLGCWRRPSVWEILDPLQHPYHFRSTPTYLRFLLSAGEQLCDELIDIFKSLKGADEQTKKFITERIQDLDTNVKTLITESNIMLKNPPIQNKAPGGFLFNHLVTIRHSSCA